MAPPLTDDEVRNRQIVKQLNDGPSGPAAEEELGRYANDFMQAAATGGLKDLWERQVEVRRQQVERHAAALREENPEAPEELFDLYRASVLGGAGVPEFRPEDTDPNPVYANGAKLGELLGRVQVEWPPGRALPVVTDPAEAFRGNGEATTGEPGRRRLGYLSLDNPLYGIPALLRFLHRRGAKRIVYDFEQL